MRSIRPDATLVQVLYQPNAKMLAFFSDGSVAEMLPTPTGTRSWRVMENILDECDIALEQTAAAFFDMVTT